MLRSYRQRKYRASLLLNTLWILFALSLLAFAMAWRMSLELKLTKHAIYQLRDLYAAKAALMRAMELIRRDNNSYNGLSDAWANNPGIFREIKTGEASFRVSYVYDYDASTGEPIVFYGLTDEDRKINLNSDNPINLKKMLVNLKIILDSLDKPLLNEEMIDSILDWRDADENIRASGAESEFYKERGYLSRNGKFLVLEELMLIKGIVPDSFDKLKDYLTIWGDPDGKININTARKEVLAAAIMDIPEINDAGRALSAASYFCAYRFGGDINNPDNYSVFQNIDSAVEKLSDFSGITMTDNQKDMLKQRFKVSSNFFRVDVQTRIKDTFRKNASAIFDKKENQVVYWHED